MPDPSAAERSVPTSPTVTPRAITPRELADELESGRWRKARGQLAKSENHRCCLGVACEMVGIDFLPADGRPPLTMKPWAPWLDWRVTRDLLILNDQRAEWGAVVAYLRNLTGDAGAHDAISGEAGP